MGNLESATMKLVDATESGADDVDMAEDIPADHDEEVAKRDHEHLAAIMDAERRVADAEAEMNAAKEELKNAKTTFDAAVSRLRSIITSTRDGQPELPFGESEAQAPESWRDVPLATLDIPDPSLKLLAESGIGTIGELSDWTAHRGICGVKGIGASKANVIMNALEVFWEEHPEYTKPAEEPATDDTDTAAE